MKARFYLEAAALGMLDEVFRVLSWESSQDLGAALGGAARFLGRKRWKMTLANLAAAFPEKSPSERYAIGLEAWQNAGRIAAEFAKSRHLSEKELERIVSWDNLDLARQVLAEGKGLIINIGHMGNWEVGGLSFTAQGLPLGVIARVMKNPYLDRWIGQTRSQFGETVFAHQNPFFQAVRWLKQGKIIAILIDHNLYEGGIFVPFFGRPAATSTLSGLLSFRLGCPVLSCCVQRRGSGLRIRFDGPLRPNVSADPEKEVERLTVEMIKTLEGYVRDRPGEWLWGHNRWKRQP